MRILPLLLAGAALADLQYRSRPDLAPPRLNVTIAATEAAAPGYLFVAPSGAGVDPSLSPEQPSAYILRDDGDLVWSGMTGVLAGGVTCFRPARYRGRPVLQAFPGYAVPVRGQGRGLGAPVLLDQSYRAFKEVKTRSPMIIDLHELEILNGTALIIIYQPMLYDLAPFGGTASQKWLLESIFQEIDIETGDVLFEARALDFSSPSDSRVPISGTTAEDSWDYIHINSVDKDDEGNYLVSGRNTLALYKISGRDGSLLWQLGGARSNFSVPEAARFGYQHDARVVSRSGGVEVISMFDNSAGGPDPAQDADASRARVLRLDLASGAVEEVATLRSPDRLVARSQGSHQLLANGNHFVGWGQAGAVTEYAAGVPVFNAFLDSGPRATVAMSYRAYRFEWEGQPVELPAIAALEAPGRGVTVYVSWNGDTETRAWRFYGAAGKTGKGAGALLGEVPRTSFETTLGLAAAEHKYFFAEALDASGSVLARSGVATLTVDRA